MCDFIVYVLSVQLCCSHCYYTNSSSSSHFCPRKRLTPHNRTLEVRPGRITKKLELKYDYDCEGVDTKSLLGAMLSCFVLFVY